MSTHFIPDPSGRTSKKFLSLKTSIFYEKTFVFLTFFIIPLAVSSMMRDNFTVIKWKILHLFTAFALFQLFFVHKVLAFPSFKRSIGWTFLGIISLWIFEYFFHYIPLISEVTVDRMAFIVLTIFFYQLFKRSPETLDLIGYALIFSMGCFIFFTFYKRNLVWPDIMALSPFRHPDKVSLTFGNENMAAQFFGIAVIAVFRQIFIVPQFWFKLLCGFLFCIFMFFLVATSCRSVAIGTCLGTILYGVFKFPSFYQKRIVIGVFLACILASPFLFHLRASSAYHRLEMWKNALTMAQDYPLGVGRGKFNFYHVLYQENTQIQPRSENLVDRTPHNEFLKYLTEEGWIFVGLVFCLIFLFLRHYGWELLSLLKGNERTQFAIAFFALLLVEGMVQFPFEVAFTFLTIVMVLGYVLSLLPSREKFTWPLILSIPLFVFFSSAIAALGIANLGNGCKAHTTLFPRLGCTIAPYEWRTCDRQGYNLVIQKEYSELVQHCLQQLIWRPYNFPVLFQLGYAYHQMGQMEQSCKIAWFYDRLFNHRSRLSSFLKHHCPKGHQGLLLNLSLKEHYRALFWDLPEDLRIAITRNV